MTTTRSGRDVGVGSPTALRDANRQRVVEELSRSGALSQADLARRTGLSRATVFNVVGGLRQMGVVSVNDQVRGGRRVSEVRFEKQAGIVLGIDLDRQHLRVAAADLSHEILAERSGQISPDAAADETMSTVAEWVEAVLSDIDAGHADVLGVGMGLPAPVDPLTGEVGSSAILPGWVGIPAADAMSYQLGLPVLVDNDANLAALAELTWGAGDCQDLIYLKLGAGVGAGLVLNGRVYHGAAGTAGEIGHTSIDDRGALCRCGSRGCLETVVGSQQLVALIAGTQPDIHDIDGLVALAIAGDAGAQRLLADTGRAVGFALANLCNLLAPQRVVVGGELAAAGDLLLDPMRDVVKRHSIPSAAAYVSIETSTLGERSDVLGALAMVLHTNTALSGVLSNAG